MPKVGIVAALEREVRPLIAGRFMKDIEREGRRFRFFETDNAAVVCGGIGPEAARRAAEALISSYRPTLLYSVGYAGALDGSLKVGSLIQPARVINAKDGSSVSICNGQGVLLSYSAVASPGQKIKLREAFAAQAVDMEASAVASAAEARGVEFRAVKVISDEADFDFPPMEKFVDSDGKFSEGKFGLFVAVRPWLWPGVFRLARNSRSATRVLCEQLEKITGGQVSPAAPLRPADERSIEK